MKSPLSGNVFIIERVEDRLNSLKIYDKEIIHKLNFLKFQQYYMINMIQDIVDFGL